MTGPTVVRPPHSDTAPGPSTSPPRGKRLQPTVIQPPTRGGHAGPRPPDARDRPAAPRVSAPTAVRGVERKRLEVASSDLEQLAPGASAEVVARALTLVQQFVIEDAKDRTVVLWGHQLQQEYAGLVSGTLARSQADVLTRVTSHLNRMMEILASIDLAAVVNTVREGGGLGRYFKKRSKKIDTPEELAVARTELAQLVNLMSAALDDLLALKAELEESSGQVDRLGDEAEAAALGAQFLSGYLQGKDERLSRLFLERSMSLTQTALQIRGSGSMRESQIEQPLRLITSIQDVALVMVPAWLGSISSLMTISGREPTPTEAAELDFQLRKILQHITTRG